MNNIPTFDSIPGYLVDLSSRIEQLSNDIEALSGGLKKVSPPREAETFIGIEEACKLIHLAKPTIYKLAQKGLIPHYKPCKELLFRQSELIKWVEESHRLGKASIDDMAKALSSGNRRKPKRWD